MANLPEVSNTMKRNWGWLLSLGIIFVVLGFISLGMVVSVTMASMFLVGVLVFIAGICQVIDGFKSCGWRGFVGHFLIALLYLFLGAIIFYNPFLASALLTILFAWILIIIGVTRIITSFSIKSGGGWAWILLGGIVSVILGLLILFQWPMSGLWLIGLLVSIELIVNGWAYILLAFAIRE